MQLSRRRGVVAASVLAGVLALTACTGESSSSSSSSPRRGSSSDGKIKPDSPDTRPDTDPSPTQPRRGPARDGDVDGDGQVDELSLTEPSTLTVVYSGGGSDTVPFETDSFFEARILGASDADRDGHSDVFVEYGGGASFLLATIFRYVDGHLRLMKLTTDDGQVSLPYGGSTGAVSSWACRPDAVPEAAIATASGTSAEPNIYNLELKYYTFDGTRLVLHSGENHDPRPLDELPFPSDDVSGSAGCGQVTLEP